MSPIPFVVMVVRGATRSLSVTLFNLDALPGSDRPPNEWHWHANDCTTPSRKVKDNPGAGERIRTVDLRIPSASSGNLPQSEVSTESLNPNKIKTPETAGNHQDP